VASSSSGGGGGGGGAGTASSSGRDGGGATGSERRRRSRSRSSRSEKGASRREADRERGSPKKKRSRKRFAWMDSEDDDGEGDEDDDKVSEASSASSKGSDRRGASSSGPPPPATPEEVQTLSQMTRYMASLPRAKVLRLPIAELAAICQAAARTHYYEGSVFGDVTSAIKVHLRGRAMIRPVDIADVVTGLADLNAYEQELFELACRALNIQTCTNLDRPIRKRLLDAFKKVNHKTNLPILEALSMQEKAARYEAACEEVAACWQKPGMITGANMPLGLK